ncbi:hypothetical protein F4780DRAFT_795206 [Xylariomycetidae sp. FL0641]|nr:hypothetical protein F4780DRAFT_795206 [Xylariomycetidae sp. FL0641]
MAGDESSPNGRDHEVELADKPEEDQNPAQKRKANSPSPNEDADANPAKRSKVLDDKEPVMESASAPATKPSEAERRKKDQAEEKRRTKRLFGGLLNTLSQSNTSSQQKRRQEIERRQQTRVHQQRVEDDKQRQERLAKLQHERKIQQINFDEDVMKTRHTDLRAKAQFLTTRSRPTIYYKPWKLTLDQEDTIDDQVRDAEALIEKELEEFKVRKRQRLRELGVAVKSPTPEPKVEEEPVVGKPETEKAPTDDSPRPDTTNPTSPPPPVRPTSKAGPEKESDRADDVMIEEDEDTVIY